MAEPTLGRDCTIKKNDVTIGFARNVSVTVNGNTIDITALGDEWAKNAIGMSSYEVSFEYLYVKDNTEQNAIESAAFNRTALTDIEIYVDATTYYHCDIVTDADANMKVSSWGMTFDNENAVSVPVTLVGSGPIKKSSS
jgi:hypothetical protein